MKEWKCWYDQMMEKTGNYRRTESHSDQMAWVGAVNNIRNAAEEIVCNEIIFA